MTEKTVLVGVLPEAVVIAPGQQVAWLSNSGNLTVEFDPNRCPFSSNIFQAPAGVRVQSGPARPGTKSGSYRYRIALDNHVIGHCEIIVRSDSPSDR